MWKTIAAELKYRINRLSMRTSLVIAILAMGMLAMVLALVIGGVYRGLAVENQRSALAEILHLKVGQLLEEEGKKSQSFILRTKAGHSFYAVLQKRNAPLIQRLLNDQFLSSSAVAGEIKIEKLNAYDGNLDFLASSSVGPAVTNFESMCRSLRTRAGRQRELGKLNVLTDTCYWNNKLYFATLIPIGNEPVGYLMVVTDAIYSIIKLESMLETPLKNSHSDGSIIYKSETWDEVENNLRTVETYQTIGSRPGSVSFNVSALRNIEAFHNKFARRQYTVLLIATIVTIQAIFIALFVLQKTAITPLQTLAMQLRKVMQDKDHLGQPIPVSGNVELCELGEGFNAMTTRLKELYESLEQLAFTDPLTGLPNRTLFHDRLAHAISTSRRGSTPFALFIMDLDRFKDINDSLGHHVGDVILQQVGKRLKTKLRESDTVARMGGDEFAILLPTVSSEYSAMAARMLLKALRVPFEVNDHTFDIGASIGIALFPDHGEDANALIQHADVAMYAAKNANSGFAFYSPSLGEDNAGRLAMMTELRLAIEQEQFIVYYQPKIDLTTGKTYGVEALVRWCHPVTGIMLPDAFIPLMEHTGMIRNLTPWVLSETLDFRRHCQELGLDLTASVNLSIRDVQEPYLVETLDDLLTAKETPPELLEIEITESALMTDPGRAMEVLARLSAMGVRRSIDDFGTGYSSLAYLKKLPVEMIKIDKSFVINMAHDEGDATIVRSSIELAHNMGLKVVAEGVESIASLEMLKRWGCDYAQGMLFSKPLAGDELKLWLKKSPWGLADKQSRKQQFRRG